MFWITIKDYYLVIQYRKDRGACGVMVIIVENEYGSSSSNPGLGCLHFT